MPDTHNHSEHPQLHDAADRAREAATQARQSIESNPLAVVAGGLAVGAIAGALLPRSTKEKELLAPLGRQLGERARAAVSAAREAGKSELDQLGISKDAAKDQARGLADGLAKALSSAGSAAAKSAAKRHA
jgi:ElaB/YqjD/DUF883 family membrane-anchored ribosome-binding protein